MNPSQKIGFMESLNSLGRRSQWRLGALRGGAPFALSASLRAAASRESRLRDDFPEFAGPERHL